MKKLLSLAIVLGLLSFTFESTPIKKTRVVIDAGHGGIDNGVEVNDFTEKEITEAIGRKTKFLNNNKSVEIIILRDKDEFLSLADRAKKINDLNPDLVISLHINADKDSTINGVEAFVGAKNSNYDDSKELAESFINSTPKSLAKRNVKEANLYILNNVNCPAVLLELGFLTNENDRDYLTSQIGQQRIAEMILRNIKMN